MPKTKTVSPARSHGSITKPRRNKPRLSRSVCSPEPATVPRRLTTVIDKFTDKNMDSFVFSPLNNRLSVLTDKTDIEEPRRKSWWKNLNENSRNIMEVLGNDEMDTNNAFEKLVEIDIERQEKSNYDFELSDSSIDGSVKSIVLPQRKLFNQNENVLQQKFDQIIGVRENEAQLHNNSTIVHHDKTIIAGTKNFFHHTRKPMQIFPAAILNMSHNKTVDKTKEIVSVSAVDSKGSTRKIFGGRANNKNKNIFANFILTESDDEVLDIQPKIFGFQKQTEMQPLIWQDQNSSDELEHEVEQIQMADHTQNNQNADQCNSKDNNIDIVNKDARLSNESQEMVAHDNKHQSYEYNEKTKDDSYKENVSDSEDDDNNGEHDDNNSDNNINQENADVDIVNETQKEIDIVDDQNVNNYENKCGENALPEISLNQKHNLENNYNDCTNVEIEINDNNKCEKSAREDEKINNDNKEVDQSQTIVDDINLTPESGNEYESKSDDEKDNQNNEASNELEDDSDNKNDNTSDETLNQGQDTEEVDVTENLSKNDEVESIEEIDYEESDNESDECSEHQSIESEGMDKSNSDRNNSEVDKSQGTETKSKVDISQEIDNEEDLEDNEEEMEVDDNRREIDDALEEEIIEGSPNVTHKTTNDNKDTLPEAVLDGKIGQEESFKAKERNESFRKTKSMYKDMDIRPSLAPARDSIGLEDGTTGSSVEGSGWDSHRTTRKTLRRTYGKDFTPRKSLRALVMEKSVHLKEHLETLQSESVMLPQANSTEYPNFSNHEDDEAPIECDHEDDDAPIEFDHEDDDAPIECDHEESKSARLAALDIKLQKIRQKNLEKKSKLEEETKNFYKVQSARNVQSLFKIPARPPPRKITHSNKPKKQPTVNIFGVVPPEVMEDMKYKPPKRFKPANASWITKRLYKFLENKLEQKYDYRARVRAEKLVETVYNFTKDLRRQKVASIDSVKILKHEFARLNIVKTHFEFYDFFQEFMPREVRVKVVPDLVNKIALPRHGIFSDIL